MFSSGSLKRILITSVLSQIAFYIGWYGIGDGRVLIGGLIALALITFIGLKLIDRWQTTGYRRLSEKVKLPTTVGSRSDGEMPRAKPVQTAPAANPVARPPSVAPQKKRPDSILNYQSKN